MSDSASTPGTRESGLSLRIAGIDVHLPLSSILGVGIIAWLWASNFRSVGSNGIVLAIVFAVLVYVGIALHEFAHAFTARAFGYPVHGITLWILGGFTVYQRRQNRPGPEAAIAFAGPATTLVLAGVAWVAERGFDAAGISGATRVCAALVWTNVILGIVNLLPGIPLDGGTILKSAVWAVTGSEVTGTRVAAWAGRVLAALVVAASAFSAFSGSSPDIIALVIGVTLGWFLWSGASAALSRAQFQQRLPGLSARSLARRAVGVPGSATVAEALRRRQDADAGSIVVLGGDGAPAGIASADAINAIPRERLEWVPVSHVARSLGSDAAVPLDASGEDVLDLVQQAGRESYLVVDEQGLVYGVLETADLAAALEG